MKKSFFMLLLLVAAVATGFAQIGNTGSKTEKKSDLTAKVPVDKKVRMGKLDNGFTYYIRANKKPENIVQFRLVTNAGSILEDEDQLGLAHFCEHMAFNGTQYYKGNEMISELQKVITHEDRVLVTIITDGYENASLLGKLLQLRPNCIVKRMTLRQDYDFEGAVRREQFAVG